MWRSDRTGGRALSHEECPASPWGAVKLARRGKAVRNLESAAAEMMGVSWQLKGVPESKGAAFARPLPVKLFGYEIQPRHWIPSVSQRAWGFRKSTVCWYRNRARQLTFADPLLLKWISRAKLP